jgi:hypothetical protein
LGAATLGCGVGFEVFGFLGEEFEFFFEVFEVFVDFLGEFEAGEAVACGVWFEGFGAGLELEFGEAGYEGVCGFEGVGEGCELG